MFWLLTIGGPDTPRGRFEDDLRLAREGSLREIAAYLETLRPALRRGLHRVHPSRADEVEDMLQFACLSLLKNDGAAIRAYEGRCPLAAFLHGIVHQRAKDYLQPKGLPTEPLGEDETQHPGSPHDDPLDTLLRRETMRSLWQAIDCLRERDRRLLVWRYLLHMSLEEIAGVERISYNRAAALFTEIRTRLLKLRGEDLE